MTTFWIFTVKTALILKVINSQFNNILALVCFILRSTCVKIIRNNEKAEASSYFAVEILYEGIFVHVTTFLICTHVKIVLIATTANIPITN